MHIAQKMKFSIKVFFKTCDEAMSFLQIWSHLLKKFLMEDLIFCEVEALYWTDSGIEDSLNAGMWNNKHTAKI